MKNVKAFLSVFAVLLIAALFLIGCAAPTPHKSSDPTYTPASGGGGGTTSSTSSDTGSSTSSSTSSTPVVLPKGPAAVTLGIAGNFTVLAASGITTTGVTSISGDIGNIGSFTQITGFTLNPLDATAPYATSPLVIGGSRVYAGDYPGSTMVSANTAMINAYTDASTRLLPNFIDVGTAGNIGGLILAPGLYKFTNAVNIPTDITFNGGPNDTWIIQIAGTLNMTATSAPVIMHLSGGAQAKNIYWAASGAVSLTSAPGFPVHFEGILMTLTGISTTDGTTMNSRLYAQTAVSLIGTTIVHP